MKIALDYDNTYSADPMFWQGFIKLCKHAGHEVRIVTARDERFDRTEPLEMVEGIVSIIYTRGIAKRWYCEHFAEDFLPDIWIDDRPESILDNSDAPVESLASWRKHRDEAPSTDMLVAAERISRDMEKLQLKTARKESDRIKSAIDDGLIRDLEK